MALPDHYRATRNEVEQNFGYPTRRALELFALNGGGPIYEKVGRKCLYRISNVESWLRDHAVRSTSEAV